MARVAIARPVAVEGSSARCPALSAATTAKPLGACVPVLVILACRRLAVAERKKPAVRTLDWTLCPCDIRIDPEEPACQRRPDSPLPSAMQELASHDTFCDAPRDGSSRAFGRVRGVGELGFLKRRLMLRFAHVDHPLQLAECAPATKRWMTPIATRPSRAAPPGRCRC